MANQKCLQACSHRFSPTTIKQKHFHSDIANYNTMSEASIFFDFPPCTHRNQLCALETIVCENPPWQKPSSRCTVLRLGIGIFRRGLEKPDAPFASGPGDRHSRFELAIADQKANRRRDRVIRSEVASTSPNALATQQAHPGPRLAASCSPRSDRSLKPRASTSCANSTVKHFLPLPGSSSDPSCNLVTL